MPVQAKPRRRWLLRRLLLISGLLLAGLLAFVAWAGWPSEDRLISRYTSLAQAEAGEWIAWSPTSLTAPVRVVGESGLAVDLRVLRPSLRDGERLPVVVLLGGHRTGRDAVRLVGDPGPVAVVALDYPYSGPDRLRGFRQIVSNIPVIRNALLDTPAAVSLALDWVLQQPWADPQRLELVGVSLGTQFTAVAGARDPRFRRVWFLHGAGDSRTWVTLQLGRRVPWAPLRQVLGSTLWWLAHGATLDPQRWVARIAPRPVVIVGGKLDAGLPPRLVSAFHDVAAPPKRLAWTETGHVSARRPETVRPLLDLLLTDIAGPAENPPSPDRTHPSGAQSKTSRLEGVLPKPSE